MIARSVHDDSEDLPQVRRVFESLSFKWTPAFNLTQGQAVMVPFDWFFAINEFNGSSAGNCREEAVLQGICEIVERHVSSIISHEQRRVPKIHPESALDPLVVHMQDRYRQCGIRLHLSDFTLDTGIPTVGVLAYDPQTHPATSEIVWTAGTTPNPEKALSRALTEVAQSRLTQIHGAREDTTVADFRKRIGYERTKRMNRYWFSAAERRGFSEIPSFDTPDFLDDIALAQQRLREAGLSRMIVVNLTRETIGVPVVRVVVPGLEVFAMDQERIGRRCHEARDRRLSRSKP